MRMEFYSGLRFIPAGDEFKTRKGSLHDALDTARVGASKKYHSVTVYAAIGENVVEIPYAELSHLEPDEAAIEKEIKLRAERK